MFLPVSTDAKSIKIEQETPEL